VNNHPTVKPLSLLRYLCKLTATPTGGTVLDPFMGSGSTGIAALLEGRSFIGVEMERASYVTSKQRIKQLPYYRAQGAPKPQRHKPHLKPRLKRRF
jgi:DNA modification methylase